MSSRNCPLKYYGGPKNIFEGLLLLRVRLSAPNKKDTHDYSITYEIMKIIRSGFLCVKILTIFHLNLCNASIIYNIRVVITLFKIHIFSKSKSQKSDIQHSEVGNSKF